MVVQTAESGRVLAHKYRLDSHLGEGGFGTIWRAHHLVLEAPVAVKLIDPDIATDDAAKERFLREAKAAASLRSPHVVQILDYGVDELQPFIVMELLEGETLAQRIKRTGPLGPAACVRIVVQVARAIIRAHEMGIVHRDLKPDNVFLVHNDDDEVAKVLDFGLAKVETTQLGRQGTVTRTGSLLGTPFYMSPEQAQGNKEVDFRSDLWSLGVIAFEMMTGKRPFSSDGLGDLVLQICVRPLPVPSEFAPVPQSFDLWFAHACARSPDARFQSARELADSLREALEVDADEAVITVPDEEHPALARARFAPLLAASDSQREPKAIFAAETVRDDRGLSSQAATARADALTDRQFGTVLSEDQRKPKGRGLVLFVAASALVVGLGAGFGALKWRAFFGGQSSSGLLATPDVQSGSTDAERWLMASAMPVAASVTPPASGSAEATETENDLDGGLRAAKAPSDASGGESSKSDAARKGPPSSWYPTRVDGGWVKPEWARPDPEPDEPAEPDNPY